MDVTALSKILSNTTSMYRKGENATQSKVGPVEVTELYLMPHVSQAPPGLEMVDVEFMVIGVDRAKALQSRDYLVELLDDYPEPERLRGGPSYIEVGAHVGGQDQAFRLFALGKVLGLWEVMTPEKIRVHGEEAIELARSGLIMITGFKVR